MEDKMSIIENNVSWGGILEIKKRTLKILYIILSFLDFLEEEAVYAFTRLDKRDAISKMVWEIRFLILRVRMDGDF